MVPCDLTTHVLTHNHTHNHTHTSTHTLRVDFFVASSEYRVLLANPRGTGAKRGGLGQGGKEGDGGGRMKGVVDMLMALFYKLRGEILWGLQVAVFPFTEIVEH